MFSYVKNEQLEYVLSFKFCSFTRKDESEVNSYFNEDFVTQHDILRELAMHQSSQEPIEKRSRLIVNISQNNLPKWWKKQKQQLIDHARLLSISTGWHIFSLSKIHTYTFGNLHNIDCLSHCIQFFLQMNCSRAVGATFKHPTLRF